MNTFPNKRASLYTLGCRLNQAETAMLAERLVEAGYTLTPFGEPADLGIIHTCTVTNEADSKSRKAIRQFIRKNPEAYTAVIGCYAQLGVKVLEAIEGVDLIVGNQEKLNVLDYVAQGKNETPLIIRDMIARDDFTIEVAHSNAVLTHRSNLKVQDGCDYMCSYCIIPFARGRARSREMANLLEEAQHLVANGAKELVLTGVNIGTYDYQGMDVSHIVENLGAIKGLRRIRIGSLEPKTIPERLFDFMNDPAHPLVPYLHIPLQSGSNRILAAMKRNYTREEFLDFVHLAQERVPGIGIGTDILVGFPGETEEDFEDSCALLEKSPLFYAHVFKYSERQGAASTRLEGKLNPQTINARSARLRTISARKTLAFHQQHLHQDIEVLFETQEGGCWSGYTGNYLRVSVESDERLENKIHTVRITKCAGELSYGELST